VLPLGQVGDRHGTRTVGVPLKDTFFSYMAGRSRYGKTELGLVQFIHLARAGHGGLFLDPHADAIAEIKHYLTDPEIRDRVVEINLAGPAARQRQPGWNPLAMAGHPLEAAEAKVEALVDAFASALQWDERNTRALALTTQSAQALIELSIKLPAEAAPTLFPDLDAARQSRVARGDPAARLGPDPAVLHRALPAPAGRGDHARHQPHRPPPCLDPGRRAARVIDQHLQHRRGDGRGQDRPGLPRLGRHPRPAAGQLHRL
jgi:hypothetical protein